MERIVNDRDCAHCVNYVPLPDDAELKSCCKWECEYEPLPEPYKGEDDAEIH